MGKYRHNTNGSTELVLVKQNFLLRGIRDSRTLIVQVLIGAMHGLVVSILVIRNFALTEFALARLHCIYDIRLVWIPNHPVTNTYQTDPPTLLKTQTRDNHTHH